MASTKELLNKQKERLDGLIDSSYELDTTDASKSAKDISEALKIVSDIEEDKKTRLFDKISKSTEVIFAGIGSIGTILFGAAAIKANLEGMPFTGGFKELIRDGVQCAKSLIKK